MKLKSVTSHAVTMLADEIKAFLTKYVEKKTNKKVSSVTEQPVKDGSPHLTFHLAEESQEVDLDKEGKA